MYSNAILTHTQRETMVRSVESRQEGVRMKPLVVDGGFCSTETDRLVQRQISGRQGKDKASTRQR